MTFGSRLDESIELRGRLCAGIDPHPALLDKWGLTDSDELFTWYSDITKGKIERKNGSIVLTDLDGSEKVRWNFFQGWPTKWDGPDFNAEGTDAAIETLEIAHEGIERA